MKAFQVPTPDGPFIEIEVPTPTSAPHQVLVKNSRRRHDSSRHQIRAGQGGHANQPLPAILGLDMAGIVEAVGSAATTFAPGVLINALMGS